MRLHRFTTIHLNDPILTYEERYICEGDSLLVNGQYYTEEGTAIDTLVTQDGCDSVIHTLLTFSSHYEEFHEYSICEGDSLLIAGQYFSNDTSIVEIFQTVAGCDSIFVHELTIKPDVFISTGDTIICRGDQVQLMVEGATDVQWSPSYALTCTDCVDPIAYPETTTLYTVTAVNCYGETIEATALVEVNQPPQVSISLDETTQRGTALC